MNVSGDVSRPVDARREQRGVHEEHCLTARHLQPDVRARARHQVPAAALQKRRGALPSVSWPAQVRHDRWVLLLPADFPAFDQYWHVLRWVRSAMVGERQTSLSSNNYYCSPVSSVLSIETSLAQEIHDIWTWSWFIQVQTFVYKECPFLTERGSNQNFRWEWNRGPVTSKKLASI